MSDFGNKNVRKKTFEGKYKAQIPTKSKLHKRTRMGNLKNSCILMHELQFPVILCYNSFMKKIVIRDSSIIFLYLSIFVLILGVVIAGYPQDNDFMGSYWYLKGLIFGIYGVFIIFNSLKEKINYISLYDNKINIKCRKLLKTQVFEFDVNNIQNCTMYISKDNIRLNIVLNNNEIFNFNNKTVTPVLIEKISKISNFVNKFDYIICTADFPNRANTFEKIINQDKDVILQQRIYSFIITFAIVIMAAVLTYATIYYS